jgi:regulator of nonsense transcripts 1
MRIPVADVTARILVTAPTHNAVDNVMRRYIQRIQWQSLARKVQPKVLRVSTEVGCTNCVMVSLHTNLR